MKRFLDSLAYLYLLGNTKGIETEYKKIMHAKREIPASNCPSPIENLMYAAGSAKGLAATEEWETFNLMTDMLDEQAERYEAQRQARKRQESGLQKRMRLGIHGGVWRTVDTDGVFEHNGYLYRIDPSEAKYHPIDTEIGELYDMDRVLAIGDDDPLFYDMNYDRVRADRI